MKHSLKAVISVLLPVITILTSLVGIDIIIRKEEARKLAKAGIVYSIEYNKVDKQQVLEEFFAKYNSPLKPYAKDFIKVAEKYDMDYRLLPSISCIESSCGKRLIPGSYNPFGWGIYGTKVTTFDSYSEAIEVVGKGLNDNYIKKGYDTVDKIAPIYTPPAHAHWANSVNYFSNQITAIETKETTDTSRL
ncbi:glucosaminidase domain-containing protein [candidate division WWE3 bacterium]|uniref:Glucosaminidase domain-containing protein n=1 Tax=candidate division WWE3 bacterium TaxID=2053526 RepID=A0A7X9DL31_UNCKA|nr:glucosaminidase domain-containing protein [candidate division WWE3 bacterium]